MRVPVSAERSRTAWMSRIAGSPRLTIATRLNTGPASSDPPTEGDVRIAERRLAHCFTLLDYRRVHQCAAWRTRAPVRCRNSTKKNVPDGRSCDHRHAAGAGAAERAQRPSRLGE